MRRSTTAVPNAAMTGASVWDIGEFRIDHPALCRTLLLEAAPIGQFERSRRKEPPVVSAVINVAPEGNLTRYLQDIRKFPMLTSEEELSLSKRWRDHEDMPAAHKLVTSHLRLVAKIAMGYRGYGLPVG